MSTPELMTLLIGFHLSGFHDLKHFYVYVETHWKSAFPRLVSYSRFVELIPSTTIFVFGLFLALRGHVTGVSFLDATALAVCKNKRISSHRVFSGFAKRGKNTMGWFFGFKLHLLINDRGQILSFMLSPGNTDDRKPVRKILAKIFGKVFADKGYISKKLFDDLFSKGCKLITSSRSNMKPAIVEAEEARLLGKRSLIESVFNVLKNSCRIEHSRHRNPQNFLVNLISGLCAYMIKPMLQAPRLTA
jgi:transposase